MPQARRGRRAQQEEEPEQEEPEQEEPELEQDEDLEEDELEEEGEAIAGPGTRIEIEEDLVTISVPRDGREGQTLAAIGELLDRLT
jgi:hypothetical protein